MPCQLHFLYPIPYQQQMGLVHWQHLTSNSWHYSTSALLPNVEFPLLCTLIRNSLVHFSSLNGLGSSQRLSTEYCSVDPTRKWAIARYKSVSSSTRTPFSEMLNPDPPEDICISIFVLLLLFSLQGNCSTAPSMLQSGQLLLGSSSPTAPLGLHATAATECKSQIHKCLQGWNDFSAAPTSAYE